jgi:hypothetical protein
MVGFSSEKAVHWLNCWYVNLSTGFLIRCGWSGVLVSMSSGAAEFSKIDVKLG